MVEGLITLFFNLALPLLLLVVGFLVGTIVERRHLRRIRAREAELRDVLAFALRRIPEDLEVSAPNFVAGSAVISVDYFKRFAASLRGLIGGRLGAYESLFERARREAMVRMKEEARRLGADIVLNVKLETTRIQAGGRNATISVEALAYGTAYRRGEGDGQIH